MATASSSSVDYISYDCKKWYDGCNSCETSTKGMPALCTARYCIASINGYCKETFDGETFDSYDEFIARNVTTAGYEFNGDLDCQEWYDGCNTCGKGTVGSMSMCTMRACVGNTEPAFCKKDFQNNTWDTYEEYLARDSAAEEEEDFSNCKSWYDGCNWCSKGSPRKDDLAICSMRFCDLATTEKAYCKEYFNETTSEN
eukprot:CAMPEP_0170479816 /NCGR_PEP_ID=MMETSP0208-20121228/904_1 /TAXON_ID=197538 /ORGANISM="Strombidium inclinatum, Strain S3" /LENGTH=198 /DNA_ID=CAMNT_0010752275 /DNA_START=35 /DNA_END=631 /DNA_ORIENTATION=+